MYRGDTFRAPSCWRLTLQARVGSDAVCTRLGRCFGTRGISPDNLGRGSLVVRRESCLAPACERPACASWQLVDRQGSTGVLPFLPQRLRWNHWWSV